MTENSYFSAVRDREVIDNGGFYCEACLTGKKASDQSDDARFCRSCFKFLLDEAAILRKDRSNPHWVPVVKRVEDLPADKHHGAKLSHHTKTPIGLMQHAIGRPKKEGEVHRTTEWRRKKQAAVT